MGSVKIVKLRMWSGPLHHVRTTTGSALLDRVNIGIHMGFNQVVIKQRTKPQGLTYCIAPHAPTPL